MTLSVFGQTLLNLIQTDVLQVGGQPLLDLLSNLKAHAGNAPMQAADLIVFQATAPKAGLQLEVELEQQLLALAISKLQAHMANPPPAAG